MKNLKKLASMALAMVMVVAMMVPAFAAGSASITIENASKEVTYNVYKLFDATVSDDRADGMVGSDATNASGIAYYYKQGDPAATVTDPENILDADIKALFVGDGAVFQMNSIGQITVKNGLTDDVVTAAVSAWADKQTTPTGSGVGAGGPLVIRNLEYGYYAMKSNQSEAAVTVTSTAPDAKIWDKTQVEIPEIPDNAKTVTSTGNSYALGETVDYRIEIPTTNFIGSGEDAERVTDYRVEDNLGDGALYMAPNAKAKIEVYDANGNKVAMNDMYAWSSQVNQANGHLVCTIPWGNNKSNGGAGLSYYPNGSTIVITYSATVVGTGTVANGVKVTYNSGKDIPGTPTVDVYNAAVQIYKHDAKETADNKMPLAGAEFALKNAAGKYYSYTTDANNNPKIEWVDELADATKYTTNAEGALETNFVGLAAGNYTLVETEAPAGYNKMADKAITIGEAELAAGSLPVDVPNETGAVLPSTGGMGTTIFYAVGGVLLAGSAILFVTKKRMG